MKSKTKIEKQAERKKNPGLFESIIKAKKNKKWLEIAGLLSSPRRNKIVVNLDRIEKESKEGETILVPGKILGKGDINKRIRVVAFSYSSEARKKLKESKCNIKSILEEIKTNPKAEGVKILR